MRRARRPLVTFATPIVGAVFFAFLLSLAFAWRPLEPENAARGGEDRRLGLLAMT